MKIYQLRYSEISEIIHNSEDVFICSAYQSMLYRDPDEVGYNNCLVALQEGASKAEIVYSLYNSSEYKEKKSNCGFLLSEIDFLINLENIIFIEYVYLRILNRYPDNSGLTYYSARSTTIPERLKIIQEISKSPEAKKRNYINGFKTYLWLHFVISIPIFGSFLILLIYVTRVKQVLKIARSTESYLINKSRSNI